MCLSSGMLALIAGGGRMSASCESTHIFLAPIRDCKRRSAAARRDSRDQQAMGQLGRNALKVEFPLFINSFNRWTGSDRKH